MKNLLSKIFAFTNMFIIILSIFTMIRVITRTILYEWPSYAVFKDDLTLNIPVCLFLVYLVAWYELTKKR